MSLSLFFQLIRWKNLLIIFAMQLLIAGILLPKIESSNEFLNLTFWLLSTSVLFLAASGYIINDIIDVPSDRINKKEKMIVGTKLSLKTAKFLYFLTSLFGFVLGGFASLYHKQPLFSLIFVFFSLLLFLYSFFLKSTPLLGNVVVAFFISSSILLIGLFELDRISPFAVQCIVIYSIFAFIINLLREIVKDLEDINGDQSIGYRTLPILMGRKRTNKLVQFLSFLFIVFLVIILMKAPELQTSTRIYGAVLIVVPTAYFISKITDAKTKKEYGRLSSILKIIMLLGLGSIFTL